MYVDYGEAEFTVSISIDLCTGEILQNDETDL